MSNSKPNNENQLTPHFQFSLRRLLTATLFFALSVQCWLGFGNSHGLPYASAYLEFIGGCAFTAAAVGTFVGKTWKALLAGLFVGAAIPLMLDFYMLF